MQEFVNLLNSRGMRSIRGGKITLNIMNPLLKKQLAETEKGIKQEQRQRLIDSFVNAVYLYEDKIILTFNYKDGSKTITLAEVEGSDLSAFGALWKGFKVIYFEAFLCYNL